MLATLQLFPLWVDGISPLNLNASYTVFCYGLGVYIIVGPLLYAILISGEDPIGMVRLWVHSQGKAHQPDVLI